MSEFVLKIVVDVVIRKSERRYASCAFRAAGVHVDANFIAFSAPLRFLTRMPPAFGAVGGTCDFAASVSVGAVSTSVVSCPGVTSALSSISVTVDSPAQSFGSCDIVRGIVSLGWSFGRHSLAVDHQMSWSPQPETQHVVVTGP